MTTTALQTLYANAIHEVATALGQAIEALEQLEKHTRNEDFLATLSEARENAQAGLASLARISENLPATDAPPRNAMKAIATEALSMSERELFNEDAKTALLISGAQRISHHILAQCLTLRAYAERLTRGADIIVLESLVSDTCDTIDSLTDIAIGEA